MTADHDTAAPVGAHPFPVPHSTGSCVAFGGPDPNGYLQRDEFAVADFDRPGLDEGEGQFVVALRWSDGTASYYLARLNPLTKRGRIRRWTVAGPVRCAAADLGVTWWAWRVRKLVRAVDV